MLLGILVIAFVCAVPMSGQAQNPASFYKGKTLTFLVTVGPGGGFDMYARMIAPFLEKETGANVIVHNMVGGEGYIALRHLYNAKPDGLNIILTGGSKVTLNQLFGDPRAKGMDIKRFVWLARVVHEPCVLMLSTKFPYRTINDLKGAKHTITSGTASSLSNQHLALAILAEAIGLDAKIVVGFSGSAEQSMAAMRGELSAFMISAGSAAEFVKQPELFPLVTASLSRAKLFPNLPAINELVNLTPAQVKWFQKLDKLLSIERPIFSTPGVPADRVKFLRAALGRVMTNKEFLEVANRNKRLIDYLPGEEVEKMMNELLTMPANEVKELKDVLDRHMMKSLMK
jgi:tripartite-type tricarboxylate transporter receptor subunit TctC